MNGHYASPAKSFGADEYVGAGTFRCNGAANPVAADIQKQMGLPFTVAYSATGIFTLQFPVNLRLPKRAYFVDARLQSLLADWGDFSVIENSLHLQAARIVLQLQRGGVAQAPPALAQNAWVQFLILASNNTGA